MQRLICKRCKYSWIYRGYKDSKIFKQCTICPACRTSVSIPVEQEDSNLEGSVKEHLKKEATQ